MATACAKPPPNGQGLTPVRRHDPLAAVDVSALSGIIGMLSAINRNTVRLRSEQVSAFVGIRNWTTSAVSPQSKPNAYYRTTNSGRSPKPLERMRFACALQLHNILSTPNLQQCHTMAINASISRIHFI